MTPKVTIIVPMYNLELYVERCLTSLLGQTLRELEILVVDDGSTDDTTRLVEELVDAHPGRIRSFRKPNGGHGSACNFGIERATGEYLMIVDGDDFLGADTAQRMYEKASAEDADMLVGNLRYVASGYAEPHRPFDHPTEKLLDAADRSALFRAWATPCARLYRRALFADPLLRFLPGILFADVSFAPKTYLAAQRIYYVNESLYNYDITRPSQSLWQTDRRILDVVPALRDAFRFYEAHGAFDAHRADLLQYALRHCVAWIGKVEVLKGYDRGRALAQLFGVLDEFFGEAWIHSSELLEVAGPRRTRTLRMVRPLGYVPAAWWFELRDRARALDARVERLLTLPARAYRKAKTARRRLFPAA